MSATGGLLGLSDRERHVCSVISSEKVSAKPELDDVGTSSIVITGAVGQ
jgi:hypothetical protein